MARSRILYACVLFTSLLFVFFLSDRLAFTALYAILLLPLFSLATVLAAPSVIRVQEQADKQYVFKNEAFTYRSRIVNRSFFPYPRIQLSYYNNGLQWEEEALTALQPCGSMKKSARALFPHRGVYRMGIQSITVTDFLGLFRISFGGNRQVTVMVYPEIDEEFTVHLNNTAMEVEVTNYNLYNNTMTDVGDVRKYTTSDEYRRIHWKLTAKRNELIVKNYQSVIQNHAVILLDTLRIQGPKSRRLMVEDRMVSTVASAINFCTYKGLPVRFLYGPDETQAVEVHSQEELKRIFPLLAEIPFDREKSALHTDRVLIPQEWGMLDLILVLGYMDREMYQFVCETQAAGRKVTIYYFGEDKLSDDSGRYLDALSNLGVVINQKPVS